MQNMEGLQSYLVETSPIGAWVLDTDGTTVWFNPVMCGFLGRPAEELDGLPAREVFDDEGKRSFEAFLTRMRAGQGSERAVECLLHRPDGSTTWALITATTMSGEDGQLFILRVLDYDHRRSLYDELHQAQALGRMGSWRYDYRTGETSWSEELYRVLGRDPAAGPMVPEEFAALVVVDDHTALSLRRQAGPFTTELRMRRPGGELIWLRVQGVVTGPPGAPGETVLATLQEITEQKVLELRLREALETSAFLRAIASAANNSTTLATQLDLSLQQMLAYDPTARLTTFQPVLLEDGTVEFDPVFPGRDYSMLSREQTTPTPRETELAHEVHRTHRTLIDDVTVPGSVLVARAVRHRGELVAVVILTMMDDTTSHERWLSVSEAAAAQAERVMERERAAVELGKARDEAMSSSRQKSDFLAMMSHEIRTPMNGVIGLNDLLLRTPLDGNQRRLAEGVQAAGQSLLTVINDILDFSKIEAGMLHLEKVDFDVRQLFDNVVAMQGEPASVKGIELAAEVQADVPTFVRGDPTRLGQIVTNLVSNALKFTRAGEVIVSCRLDAGDSDPGGALGGDVVLRIEVVDTGIGIPQDLQAGLFDPFTQAEDSTTRRFGGTGLGLAICRQLVSAIGGDIGVDSAPGVGSTFWFTGRFELGERVEAPSRGVPPPVLEGRRVLVVDDNASNRRILAEVLTEWGTSVESAAGAQDAVERARRASLRGEPFDVVLLDLVMPGHSGLELAGMIRSAIPRPWPTMLLLSSAQGVDKQQLEAAGIARTLTKPVNRSALFNELVVILAEMHGLAGLTAAGSEPPVAPLGRRVLVVEDNEINQMVALGVLQALGYATDVASNGEEAVAMAGGRPGYDAIVMDVQMPVMDGYTATRLIRSSENDGHRVPIIAMTAAAVEGERERCLAAGMDDFLTKPLQPDRLEQTLREHIEGAESTVPSRGATRAVDRMVGGQVIDVSRLDTLRAMGPDATVLVRRAVDRFVAQSADSVNPLRQAVSEGDSITLHDLAHRLGGSAANLGAVQVAARCQELERLEPVEAAGTQLIDLLESALEEAVDALARLAW